MLMHKPCILLRYGFVEIYGAKQQIDVYGLKVKILYFQKNNDNKFSYMNMGMTKKKDRWIFIFILNY
jgi:hypothetical protein